MTVEWRASQARRRPAFYDPTWSITVYAVSRQHRAVAQRLLCEQGIPAIAAWLRKPRSDTWLQGRKEMAVCFNEKEPSVIMKMDRAE